MAIAAALPKRPLDFLSRKAAMRVWHKRTLYLFLLPFAALTAVFGLWPIGQSIYLSFTESYTALSPEPVFVGLENFGEILTNPDFLDSLWRTLLFTFVSVVLNVLVALGLAVMLSQPILERGRTLFKLAIFLPVITPDVAGFIVWKWMFNQDFGVVNAVLYGLGLPPFAGVTEPTSAFATLTIVELWHHVGLYTLIFLTNMQLLDRDLDEAARIDGATRWQRFRYVTLPQLRPAIIINSVYALIEFLKTFTVIVVITRGGPNFSTNFVSYFAYTKFGNAQYGEAMAMATVLFAAVAVLAAALLWVMSRSDYR
jgi:ABC-type sugar transport system permease subunit